MFTDVIPCLFTKSHGQARKRHIRNCNKNLLRSPCYRLVKAVKLSLQSGRNTQLRTCSILVIFNCFRNITDAIISNKKKHKTFIYITINIYDIIQFEELSFQSTLIRNYFYLFWSLLVPGQASQENLLVRQVLRTSWAWRFHTLNFWLWHKATSTVKLEICIQWSLGQRRKWL